MAQRIIRVYVDSSVFGGVHDIEFSRPRRLFFADALHVAVATVSGCSVIVSWNFKHIVNYRKIPLYNAINRTAGYHDLAIHSPWEVIGEEGI